MNIRCVQMCALFAQNKTDFYNRPHPATGGSATVSLSDSYAVGHLNMVNMFWMFVRFVSLPHHEQYVRQRFQYTSEMLHSRSIVQELQQKLQKCQKLKRPTRTKSSHIQPSNLPKKHGTRSTTGSQNVRRSIGLNRHLFWEGLKRRTCRQLRQKHLHGRRIEEQTTLVQYSLTNEFDDIWLLKMISPTRLILNMTSHLHPFANPMYLQPIVASPLQPIGSPRVGMPPKKGSGRRQW